MYYFKDPPSDQLPSVIILDQNGDQQHNIRQQLANYKKRWGVSIADKVAIVNTPDEFIPGVPIIVSEYMSSFAQSGLAKTITVSAISLLTHYHLRSALVKTSYEVTDQLDQAMEWLNSLTGPFTADFESASKFDDEEKAFIQDQLKLLDPEVNQAEYIELQQQLESSGLSHPSLTDLTHLVIGLDEENSYVIILTPENQQPVLNFLVETELKQIWHNLSFDGKHILYHTGKFPKNYEDTQLLAWAYKNHANTFQAKVGLKGLAEKIYSNWAVASDMFNLDNKYDPQLLEYAGIDGNATWFVWNEFSTKEDINQIEITTNLLPVGDLIDPSTYKTPRYFYENVMKPSIPDMVEMMLQGININQNAVEELRNTVDNVLETVRETLASNPIIQEFQDKRFKGAKEKRISELKTLQDRPYDSFIEQLSITKADHRSYLLEHLIAARVGLDLSERPTDCLPNGIPKWSVNAIKKLAKTNINNERFHRILQKILKKEVNPQASNCLATMEKLAKDKYQLFQGERKAAINAITPKTMPSTYKHAFNPNSPNQKKALFRMLDIESEETTKTGEPSWNRAQVERVNKETNDPNVKEITQMLIDFSFSAIIRNNFIRAFDRFVVDGVLYGNVKIGGTKTYRLTSSNPNLLNLPSSRSIYAKPLKKCLVAPKGFLIAGSDYSALEEVVGANITKDTNKVKILGSGYDSHCFHTLYYWRDQVEKYLGKSDDSLEFNKLFKAKTKEIPELDKLRSNSKSVSFGLGYGCMPAKVAHQIKGTLEDGEAIWNRYHYELYPEVTKFREEHVLKQAKQNGEVYLGLGLSLKTDRPEQDIRTLFNAKNQFWSLLTLLTIQKMNRLIKANNLQNDIQVIATIYDSIYFNVREDVQTIKWLNDHLIPIMVADFLEEQPVKNRAALDLGKSFAQQIEIPNDASELHIQMLIDLINSGIKDTIIKDEKYISLIKTDDNTIQSPPFTSLDEVTTWRTNQR